MAPNLICLGVEKCGTTSLHRLLGASSGFYVPPVKEVFFFNRKWERGTDWYENVFAEGAERAFRCDITPSYFRHDETLDRIAAYAAGRSLQFLFLVRNPVYRAYSHYVHDIDRHFGPALEGYDRSFMDDSLARNAYHFTSYRRALERIVARLGRERLRLLVTERHIRQPAALSRELTAFLGVGLDAPPATTGAQAANAGAFPHYLYGGTGGLEVDFDDGHYCIPPRTLVFCSRVKPGLWQDVSPDRAGQLIRGAGHWTRAVDAETFTMLHSRHFGGEIEYLQSTFGLDLDLWQDFPAVEYALAPPPAALRTDQLAVSRTQSHPH